MNWLRKPAPLDNLDRALYWAQCGALCLMGLCALGMVGAFVIAWVGTL